MREFSDLTYWISIFSDAVGANDLLVEFSQKKRSLHNPINSLDKDASECNFQRQLHHVVEPLLKRNIGTGCTHGAEISSSSLRCAVEVKKFPCRRITAQGDETLLAIDCHHDDK